MAKKLIVCIVAMIMIIAMVIPGCGEGGEGITYKNDGIFIQETIGEVDSLDPAWAYDTGSGEQLYYMYEGLVGYDGTSTDTFVKLMCDDYVIAGDNSQIKFHIRPGVRFSNGANMTVEDVEYSFERALVTDPDYGPIWMLYFPLLDTYGSRDGDGYIAVNETEIDNAVEIVDTDWVQFNFVRPFPMTTFLQILCGSWSSIVNKQFCIDNGDWPGTWGDWTDYNNPAHEDLILNSIACGTGPWKLEVWNAPGEIKLLANEYYWKGSGTVPFDRVITKFVDAWPSRKLSILAGDADLVYCPRTNIDDLAGIADINAIKDLPELTIDSFYFNFNITADSPYIGSGTLDGNGIPTDFFSDIHVRKGLTYAFDWDTYIEEAMQGEAIQRGSCIVEGLPYFNPAALMYSFNLTEAENELKLAWGGDVWDNGFKFTLVYNTGNLVRKTACEILANNLFALNPKFQISVLAKAWSSTLTLIRGRQWAMFQIGWLPDYADPDNFVFPYMHSAGLFSGPASYYNATVDALIEEGAICTNATRRQEIYYDLQQAWYDDLPGIILAQPLGRRFFTKYIQGFEFNPTTCGQPGPLYYMTKSAS